MNKRIEKEDLRIAQEGLWSKAFDADKRFAPKLALNQLITSELLSAPVGELNKLK